MAWNEPGGNGNDNDPWGNRKNSGGPPDLDEVFKNIRKKLDGLFGKQQRRPSTSGGGGSQGGFPGGSLSGKAVGFILAVLGIIWLLSGIYVVQPAQSGVVTQFGRHVETTGPGPHWHVPWPIQQVERVDVEQIRSANLVGQQILTQDENIVDIDMTVQYNIKNAADYLFNVSLPDQTLAEVVESAVREVIGGTTLEPVLTTGRDVVWNTTQNSLQEILDEYKSGLNVTAVNLERAQPPEEVQAAFSDAVKAREDKERFINEAQAYRNEVLPQARGDAQGVLEASEAYKTRVEQAALGESERFLSLLGEYSKAPAVTRERLYIEAMESVLSNTNKVLVDPSEGGSNNLMYLPLDKLMEQNRNREGSNSEQDGRPSLSSLNNDAPRFDDLPMDSTDRARQDLRARERGTLR